MPSRMLVNTEQPRSPYALRLCHLWIICFISSLWVSITVLIWTCFNLDCSTTACVRLRGNRYPVTRWCNRTLCCPSLRICSWQIQWTMERTWIWYGVASRSVDNSLCSSVKDKISQLRPTLVGRTERGCQGLLKWLPTVSMKGVQNSMEKNWNLCGEFWGTYRSLACIGTF
jgi:hypothetical protein